MNVHAGGPASQRDGRPYRKLLKPNPARSTPFMNNNRHSITDAPAQPRSMAPATHTRSSSFFGSLTPFRTRAMSPGRPQTSPARQEHAGPGEFGALRPPLQSPASTTTSTASQPVRASAAETMPDIASSSVSGSTQQGPPGQQLHPEIRSIVHLSTAHAHKVYFSGPLIRHIERQTDGRIVGKEEPWRDVWAQLGGTTLSVWDMREIEEANRRGTEVPPTYINVTDASIHVLGSVTMPGSVATPMKYSNVLTLTTAGLNLILFSCTSPQMLISWISALRLAAYEKSRLEELYTAHLLRMSFSEQGNWRDPRSPLVNGLLEGWVKIRINGQTDWKRLWMSVQAGKDGTEPNGPDASLRKGRIPSLFGRPQHEHSNSQGSDVSQYRLPHIAIFVSSKPKDRKKAILTMEKVSQVFAVYPERPELISRSTLIKIEGTIGDEELAGEWKSREGWLLMMPEADPAKPGSLEMLRWLVGLHDAFGLYGRPTGYTWNPREPHSLMFAYPVGPQKDQLFLDRELVERIDPREDRASVVRQRMKDILIERMYSQEANRLSMSLPSSPPNSRPSTRDGLNGQTQQSGNFGPLTLPQLPPLNFDNTLENFSARNNSQRLSPVAERSEATTERASILESVRSNVTGNVVSADVNAPGRALAESSQGSTRPFDASQNQPHGSPSSPSNSRSVPQLPRSSDIVSHTPANTTNPTHDDRIQLSQESKNSPGFDRPSMATNSPKTPLPEKHSPQVDLHLSRISPSKKSTALGKEREPLSPTDSNKTTLSSPSSTRDKETRVTSSISQYSSETQTSRSPESISNQETIQAQESDYLINKGGGLYEMLHSENGTIPRPPSSENSDRELERLVLTNTLNLETRAEQKLPVHASSSQEQRIAEDLAFSVPHRSMPMALEHSSRPNTTEGKARNPSPFAGAEHAGGIRGPLGRKPSGARAQPRVIGRRFIPPDSSPLEVDEQPLPQQQHTIPMSAQTIDDATVDAFAALSFLEQDSSQTAKARAEPLRASPSQSQSSNGPALVLPQIMEPKDPEDRAIPPVDERTLRQQYRSSFSPSKIAEERKARFQAQQAAHEAAVHKPGRPNGKRIKRREDGWDSSEEEEDDEDEDDEDDGDADGVPAAAPVAPSRMAPGGPAIVPAPVNHQQLRSVSRAGTPVDSKEQQDQQRAARALPQIPRSYSPAVPDRRNTPDNYDAQRNIGIARPQAHYPQQQSHLPQSPFGASRQNMWSSALDAGRDPAMPPPTQNNARDTFVQLDSPSETMTKAFTPQGLLSAGLQDKEERSAKRQEEHARVTGSSLINVPSKPPPPQTGLLGAISAHERQRNREGGMGAALTEREREKRLAEDRQRRIDDLQRQQLEQQQQLATQFGAMGMYGGGLAPQMTGMNPMFGFPPMMAPQSMYFPPMFNPMMANPQHMYAAQQAAQAYQQAMIAMSTATSQVGGEGGVPGAGGNLPVNSSASMLNPMMGMDPRMSMYSMGMMGMPAMGGVGMQATGGSNLGGAGGVDSRFSPNIGPLDGPGGISSGQTSRLSPLNGSPSGTPGGTVRLDNDASAGR